MELPATTVALPSKIHRKTEPRSVFGAMLTDPCRYIGRQKALFLDTHVTSFNAVARLAIILCSRFSVELASL
jgi:hypothetical protein